MKIEGTAKALFTALSPLRSAVSKRPTRPITACCLITADGDEVTAQATDLERYVRVTLPEVTIVTKGVEAIPYEPLITALSKMGEDAVAIDSTQSGVTIVSPSAKLRLSTDSAEEFPEFPSAAPAMTFTLDRKALETAIRKVGHAVCKGAHFYAIVGVQFRGTSKGLDITATDGSQLSTVLIKGKGFSEFSVIVPVAVLGTLASFAASDEVGVALTANEAEKPEEQRMTWVKFTLGCSVMATRLLEGHFPPWDNVLAGPFERAATVNRRAFLDALALVGIASDEMDDVIHFSTAGDVMTLVAERSTADAAVSVALEDAKAPILGGFVLHRLREMLQCADDDTMVLGCQMRKPRYDQKTRRWEQASEFTARDTAGWRYILNGICIQCEAPANATEEEGE